MKQVDLTIPFDKKKVSALELYMRKKNLDLRTEITEAITKLYEKYVPAPVREFIEEAEPEDTLSKPEHKKRRQKTTLEEDDVTKEVTNE